MLKGSRAVLQGHSWWVRQQQDTVCMCGVKERDRGTGQGVQQVFRLLPNISELPSKSLCSSCLWYRKSAGYSRGTLHIIARKKRINVLKGRRRVKPFHLRIFRKNYFSFFAYVEVITAWRSGAGQQHFPDKFAVGLILVLRYIQEHIQTPYSIHNCVSS